MTNLHESATVLRYMYSGCLLYCSLLTVLCQEVRLVMNDKLEIICKLVALAKSGYYPRYLPQEIEERNNSTQR